MRRRRRPAGRPALWGVAVLVGSQLPCAARADCSTPLTEQQLRTRPWFCEQADGSGRTETDDLAKCLGDGHTLNNTEPGLCRDRWQWYQVSTVHDHTVPYYEIATVDGRRQHVRRTRVEPGVRHAVAFHL